MNEPEQNQSQQNRTSLTKKERHTLQQQEKQEQRHREQRMRQMKKAVKILAALLVVGGGIAALVWYASIQPNLPPTSMQGHVEENPPAHITNQPLADAVQRHMLEHADGKGKPGIIIQYNCTKYACASDLVAKLTELVKQYPDNVYLAPNNYDGEIILTKMGTMKILNDYDEQAIKAFIGS